MRWRTIGTIFAGFTALGAAIHEPFPFIVGFATCAYLAHVKAGQRLAALLSPPQPVAVQAQPMASSVQDASEPSEPASVVANDACEAPNVPAGPSREQCAETERKLGLALRGLGYKANEAKAAVRALGPRISEGAELADLVREAVQAAHQPN